MGKGYKNNFAAVWMSLFWSAECCRRTMESRSRPTTFMLQSILGRRHMDHDLWGRFHKAGQRSQIKINLQIDMSLCLLLLLLLCYLWFHVCKGDSCLHIPTRTNNCSCAFPAHTTKLSQSQHPFKFQISSTRRQSQIMSVTKRI